MGFESLYSSDLIDPINYHLTSNDRLKPVLTTGPVSTDFDQLFANLELRGIMYMSPFNLLSLSS